MARTIRQAFADGEAVTIQATETRYGTEYVAVAGTPEDRAHQIECMDICFLDLADATRWAEREGIALS